MTEDPMHDRRSTLTLRDVLRLAPGGLPEVATAAGISYQRIHRIVRGEHTHPPVQDLARIAQWAADHPCAEIRELADLERLMAMWHVARSTATAQGPPRSGGSGR